MEFSVKKVLSAVITGAVMIVSANGFAQEAGKQAVKKEEHHEEMAKKIEQQKKMMQAKKVVKKNEPKKAKKGDEVKKQSEAEDSYGTPNEKDFTSGGGDDS
jgi:hypothetical protein